MVNRIDIRDEIFFSKKNVNFIAAITAEKDGIISGINRLLIKAEEIGLTIIYSVQEGGHVFEEEKVLVVKGDPKQIAMAEELLLGLIAKPSGIASAAYDAVQKAEGRVEIVSGAWKKMPPDIKFLVREAIIAGGANFRIVNEPFLYLDKNYVRIFGGVSRTLEAVDRFSNMVKVIQLKGETVDIVTEAREATLNGADVLMVDTGKLTDVDSVSEYLRSAGVRDRVKIAFAGGVRIEDIPKLMKKDIDILDIGKQIIDAPLLDFRIDVVGVLQDKGGKEPVEELNLLEKTELWVEGIFLDGANLTDIASAVAEVLNLKKEEVLVVDVRDDYITIDILRQTIPAINIVGKESEILERLSRLKGVRLGKDAGIHSDGILGLIELTPGEAEETLTRSQQMLEGIRARVANRVKVFSSGFEVIKGIIQDTNAPLIAGAFNKLGFTVNTGSVLEDDEEIVAINLLKAVEEGYGLIITTGGVGAEDKDRTVEGVLRVDPDAACPWIVKYKKGLGRHQKEGVRIAVGQAGDSLIIALPGPTSEVAVAINVILNELKEHDHKTIFAEKIARALREHLMAKNKTQSLASYPWKCH